jgi:hypothetical protein
MDLLQYPVEQDNTVVNKVRSLVGMPVAEKKPCASETVQ